MRDTGRDTSSAAAGDTSEGTWMTYSELAAIRGIGRASAFKLALRHKWRRQKNNQGQVTILVPPGWSEPSQDEAHDVSRQIAAFETALAVIEAALVEANKRADAAQVFAERTLAELADAHARTDAAVARAEVADGDRRAAEQRAEELRERIDALQVQLAARQEVIDAAEVTRRAEYERRARGLLARLRAAWRGE